MKALISFTIAILVVICTDTSGKPKTAKQISFAIPALNLLNGGNNNNNNNNNNGNIFGPRTTTRTIVRTVATITVPAFRTCTTTAAALMPCAGRRRRDIEEANYIRVEPTPVTILKIGNTRIFDPVEVAEFLEAHRPGPSIIVNADAATDEATTTVLYSSKDVSEEQNDDINSESDPQTTTETPYSSNIAYDNNEETTPQAQDDGNEMDKARINFGAVTTLTSTIAVTSVATTFATGASATLTVMYAGCAPPSYPVVGMAC